MGIEGVVIIGTGFMGPAHTEALRRLGLPVKGILGSSSVKTEETRAALGLATAYTTFDEVLADPEVTAVHLCVPNHLHFDMARRALLAGKHVMCEKPLAMDSRETSELVALAEETGLAAGVCYNLRFYPLNIQARDMVSSGEVGRLFHINGSYVQDWLLYETDFDWRLQAARGGPLRAVGDIGTHWMDMVSMITGLEVDAVFADLARFYQQRKTTGEADGVDIDTEDYGAILFRFEGGATGSLHVSQMVAGRKNALRYEIAGAEKALAWNSERPNELWIGQRGAPNQTLIKDPALMSGGASAVASYPAGHSEGYPDTFKQCFKTFYDYIAAGDPSAPKAFPTFADGHREILLCEAIMKSSQQEQWVKIEGSV